VGIAPGRRPPKSLLLSGGLVLAWVLSLAVLPFSASVQRPWWLVLALVLLRTQLQTGLFIVAHDAMHRLIWPQRPRCNDAIGSLALALYAALPFRYCRRQHQRHHRLPASGLDPDFPADRRAGAWRWYRQFMARYLSCGQLLCLVAAWVLLALSVVRCTSASPPAAAAAVLQFATLPLLLSSLQLFVFGTYLPHRCQRLPERQPHPHSLDLPPWLSLLACFHFGYHREHHDNPGLCWFELPAERARSLLVAFP
jgi:beta-carotene ketolase (CrtW type)